MTSSTTTRRSFSLPLAFSCILLCTLVTATPVTDDDDLKADQNYLCPEDCHCVLSHHTHKPLLHAKCSSLKGLRADQALEATLPVHSIDLSYLNLTRLAHSLEKLHDLTSIDLSHNDLHEFGHLSRRIKKLNLKHNRLTSAKLTKLPLHLQTLNLQHNDITNLPLEFKNLTHLQTLELSHNPINCSCETMEVRNWLQERHVFMEHPVKCASPAVYKNKSWLQVKQSLVCEQEKKGWLAEEEENELMMGDQPIEGSGDDLAEEELGKDYMPIDKKTTTPKSNSHSLQDDVEGSGDLSEVNMPLNLLMSSTQEPEISHEEHTSKMPFEEDDYDGSGSGGGVLIIPPLGGSDGVVDDFDTPESDEENKHNTEDDLHETAPIADIVESDEGKHENDDDVNDNAPIEEPRASHEIFKTNLGIFDGPTQEPVEEEEEIKPAHVPSLGGAAEEHDPSTEGPESESVVHAKVGEADDSKATYYLWGIIIFVVLALLLFVAIKQCKNRSGGRNDPENPQTELIDMDKKQLGKPLRNGVPEHVPLIGEKSKSDMAKPINGSKPYDNGDVKDGPHQQEPLLNGNGNANGNAAAPSDDSESRPDSQLQAPHEYYPISPRYPTPQSPRASKYSQQNAEPNNNDPNQPYLPSSPKSGRYSPVYSPETGRVKIKMSETPRPKTPMLVTRSRSNAGDIITTPIRPTQKETFQPAPVHTANTNGRAGEH